jgi:hypothetical protein
MSMSATTMSRQTQLPGQTRGTAKKSALVMGIGAAAVAAVLTVAMMSGGNSPQTAAPAKASQAAQCEGMQRTLLVSTRTGGGTVRFRASGWVSPPYTLTTAPQAVTFPLLRAADHEVDEVITIEGNATDLVTSSPLVDSHNEYPAIKGSLTVTRTWMAATSCGVRK